MRFQWVHKPIYNKISGDIHYNYDDVCNRVMQSVVGFTFFKLYVVTDKYGNAPTKPYLYILFSFLIPLIQTLLGYKEPEITFKSSHLNFPEKFLCFSLLWSKNFWCFLH